MGTNQARTRIPGELEPVYPRSLPATVLGVVLVVLTGTGCIDGLRAASGGADAGGTSGADAGAVRDAGGTSETDGAAVGFAAPTDSRREKLREALETASRDMEGAAEESRREISRLETVVESYRTQLEGADLPQSAAEPLRTAAARAGAGAAVWRARLAAVEHVRAATEGGLTALRARSSAATDAPATGVRKPEELREAERAEKRALEQLRDARRQTAETSGATLQKLAESRAEILRQVADVSRKQQRTVSDLAERRAAAEETFARRQEEIESRLEQLPSSVKSKEERRGIDELFEQIRGHRSEARAAYNQTSEALQAALASHRSAERRLDRAQQQREEVRTRLGEIANQELQDRKLALAEARVEWRRRQAEFVAAEAAAHRTALELHAHRIDYYDGVLDRLLPEISSVERREHFSPWRSDNWEHALARLREAKRRWTERLELRFQQARALPEQLYSPELWGWLLGLAVRLLLLAAIVFVLREYAGRGIHRAVNWALRRPFFRNRAAGTIKFGEWIRTIMWPVGLFVGAHVNALYVVNLLPEFGLFHRLVHLGFLYWFIMSTVRLFALPRAARESDAARGPAPELGRVSRHSRPDEEDVVDLLDLDLEEARRAVRTARHIVLYGIAAWIVPITFAELLGRSLPWSLAKRLLRYVGLGLAYYELWVWRDDIASVFRGFAEGRASRLADFVETQKDRVWGGLVIAVAFAFVLLAEVWTLARRHVVQSELSRRIGNFLFRKQIELKQQNREETPDEEQERHDRLPEDYQLLFQDRPLYDERYRIRRDDVFDQLVGPWEEWRNRPRHGSLAVTGEQGMGKSTLLNRFYGHVLEQGDHDPIFAALTDKIVTIDALISYLVQLFDLPEVPQNRDELVELLVDEDPRVVLIDDCHHLFFRKIQGFEALGFFLDVVNLTDEHHFWLLTFNKYGWKYLQRVQERKHFFGYTVELSPWSASELQDAIEARGDEVPYEISFSDLVVTRGREEENYYEVVKTAKGYFRLLQEFSQGNPRVALDFWIRNLTPSGEGTLNVSLFRRPSLDEITDLTDNHLFALTALVQHGALTAGEVADVINAEEGFCEMALNHFAELEVAERRRGTGRFHLTPFYYRPVVDRLIGSNFLWT